jgi:Na+-driven multidrug efflux pump
MLSLPLESATILVMLFWVGRLVGPTGLAALAVAHPFMMAVNTLQFPVMIGCASHIAKSKGLGDGQERTILWSALCFALLEAAVIALLGVFLARRIGGWLAPDAELAEPLAAYLFPWFLGLPAFFGSGILIAAANGLGRTRFGLARQIGDLALQSAFTPLMIVGLGLGIAGASSALAASWYVLLLALGWSFLQKRDDLGIGGGAARLERSWWPRFVSVGTPPTFGRAADYIAQNLLVAVVGIEGTDALAAYNIGLRLMVLVSVLSTAIARANGIVIGHCLGSGDKKGAYASLRATAPLVLANGILWIVLAPFARPVLALFTDNLEVSELSLRAVSILRWSLPLSAIEGVLFLSFNATQKNRGASLFLIAAVFGDVVIAKLWPGNPLDAVCWAIVVGYGLRAAAFTILAPRSLIAPLERGTGGPI